VTNSVILLRSPKYSAERKKRGVVRDTEGKGESESVNHGVVEDGVREREIQRSGE
jgi:hypothetical protein